jgi:hypothetical protein
MEKLLKQSKYFIFDIFINSFLVKHLLRNYQNLGDSEVLAEVDIKRVMDLILIINKVEVILDIIKVLVMSILTTKAKITSTFNKIKTRVVTMIKTVT